MGHPSSDILGTEGKELKGKKIILGVTGSVSSYRAPDIARALMRHGADVQAVMSPSSQKMIGRDLMEWATGNPVVTELSGKIEHVAATTGRARADLILIAPATANTIGKIAAGIDDTPVTTYVSSALGAGIPIIIAPAMHDTMLNHSIIQENVRRLERAGVDLLPSTMEEGKAKLADVEVILEAVITKLTEKTLINRTVMITGGPTVEPLDPVRVLTNRSSGKMAVALARAARRYGATVTLVYGPASEKPPGGVRVVRIETSQEMFDVVRNELTKAKYDLVIATAAVSDFRPARVSKGKMSSTKVPLLHLEKTSKIVDEVKKISPLSFLTIFKAEHSLPERELVRRAVKRMKDTGADMVVVNDVGKKGTGFGSEQNEVIVIDASGKKVHLPKAAKQRIAEEILSLVVPRLKAMPR
jgi:phosphopantothenoylcysteine decarboxylase / phosphopantothenate---cysteine ligase